MSSAYHEAGHAVAARVLGQEIRCVSLHPTPKIYLTGRVPTRTWAIICLAGPAAEQRLCRYTADQRRVLWESTWSLDLGNVLQYRGSMADAVRTARRLVRQHWDAIERVADALGERGELSGDEIDDVARGGSHQWARWAVS